MANQATITLSGKRRRALATGKVTTRRRLIAAAISACFASAPAWSNPTAPQVVNGSASFNQAGKLLTVTNSNGAIINWNSFSIGAGETTRFNQANAASSVLNRVIANDPSVLLGTLSSNGRVWLVNPAGIMVGQGAKIDVAGFIASTLNVRNEDFLAGRLNFGATPNAGKIENHGQISTPSGGSVYLIAPTVANHGIINAPNGEVILAAGQTAQLIDTGIPGVKVDITGAEGNVTNLGQIVAAAGRIGMAGVLVKNSGTLNASSLVKEGGRIFLKASKRIEISAAGRVLADGAKGGEIVVKAEDKGHITGELTARGTLSAQGDGTKGTGGFVETSAAKLDLNGVSVNTGGGKWLLDPYDFTIASNGDITGAALAAALGNNDVTIETSASSIVCTGTTCLSGNAFGSGDIFVNDAIAKTGATNTTLTLQAERSIAVNAPITSSASMLNVKLQAHAHDNSAAGNVQINSNIATHGGNLVVGGGTDPTLYPAIGYAQGSHTQRYGISIQNATIDTGGGNITMRGQGIDSASSDADGINLWDASASLQAGGGNILLVGQGGNNPSGNTAGIYVGGSITTTGSGSITLQGRGGSGSTSYGNRGVKISGGTLQAADGLISVTGTAGSSSNAGIASGPDNTGVIVKNGSTIESTGTGGITIIGTGGKGTNTNGGVDVYNDSGATAPNRILSAGGSISITGDGGANASGYENLGVWFRDSSNAAIESTHSGGITIVGNGGGGISSNRGVKLEPAKVQTVDGPISITGTAGGNTSGDNNYGIGIKNGSLIEATGTGSITLRGTGGPGTNQNSGIDAYNDSGVLTANTVRTAGGAINIAGTGGANATGYENIGLWLEDSAKTTIQSTGSGSITITGTGGSGTYSNRGVKMSLSTVKSVDGSISITGSGGVNSSSHDNYGIAIKNGSLIEATGNGGITILGTGGSGTYFNSGIDVYNDSGVTTPNVVRTATGAISITGYGGANATQDGNYGIWLEDSGHSLIEAGGSGAVTMLGRGGAGTHDNRGVKIYNATVRVQNGALSITGYGGNATQNDNKGVLLASDSAAAGSHALIESTGTGSVSIEGYACTACSQLTYDNDGVSIRTYGVVSSAGGSVTISGQGAGTGTGYSYPDTWNANTGVYLDGTITANGANGSAPISISGSGGGLGIASGSSSGSSAGVSLYKGSISTTAGGTVSIKSTGDIHIAGAGVAAGITASGGGNVSLRADSGATETGTVILDALGTIATSGGAGRSDIYYNPTSYATPNDYSSSIANTGTGAYTAWMLVNDVGQASGGTRGLQAMNINPSGSYALGKNIDASATATWNWNSSGGFFYGFAPVGTYAGGFDGLNHTITGLVINRPLTDGVGLFSFVDQSAIRNVGLVGGSVVGHAGVGGLAGGNRGSIDNSYATGAVSGSSEVGGLVGSNIYQGSITNSHASGTVNGGRNVGGLVGVNIYQGSIANSYATGSVSGGGSYSQNVGGLVGQNYESSIANSYATGKVTVGTNAEAVGGLVGSNYGTSSIVNSHATGMVSADASKYIGGLVGDNWAGDIGNSYALGAVKVTGTWGTSSEAVGGLVGNNNGSITNSYATGAISVFGGGASAIGGLIGQHVGSVVDSYATGAVSTDLGNLVGGLVGYNRQYGNVTNSHATGAVSGPSDVGGLVGRNEGIFASVASSHATGTVSGSSNVGGLVGSNYGFIADSYAAGAVSGVNGVGGLVGQNSGSITDSYATGSASGWGLGGAIGGLVGENKSWITNSYATGAVIGSGGDHVGGLVGDNGPGLIELPPPLGAAWVGGHITSSFWDKQTSGQTNCVSNGNSAGCSGGLTTAQMMTQASYPQAEGEWDFANKWWVSEGNTRPFLRNEYSTTITNAHQLQLMATNLGANYTLGRDIDMSELTRASGMWSSAGFVPVGNGATGFTGQFDGLNNTVTGLVINRPTQDFVGLFGAAASGSAVRNVGLIGGSMAGRYEVGSLVGENRGVVSGSYASSSVSGTGSVGGLVGQNHTTGSIVNSYATGNVTGTGSVGGLLGYNYLPGSTVTNSYATGNVSGTSNVGGLLGVNSNGATVSNSYAIGNVTGGENAGGLVGDNYWGSAITNSFASGRVTGASNVGGLVGAQEYGNPTISSSFWDINTSCATPPCNTGIGSNDHPGVTGVGLTTAQMMTQASYPQSAGQWDFSNTWWMSEGNTRPFLRSEYSTTITNAHQLQLMAASPGTNYTLGRDIDMNELGRASGMWNVATGFVPIGDPAKPFTGVFDGAGHVISDLVINRPNAAYVGLFGYAATGSVLRDVGLNGGSVIGQVRVGGLVGENKGSITNSYSRGNVTGNDYVGGLLGSNASGGSVGDSYATGTVSAGDNSNVGGLVGVNAGNVANAYSNGTVSAGANSNAGGLVGQNAATTGNSYSTAAVSGGAASSVGGLVGGNGGSVTDSYSIGAVGGSGAYVGGLVGWLSGGGTIANSYSTGAVSGSGSVGGLLGGLGTGTITNSFWDTETSGIPSASAGGAGLTSVQMMTQARYPQSTGQWDFANTWWISEGNTRPFLRSEYSATVTNGHQLQLMAMNPGATYRLANDLDMAEITRSSGMWNTTSGFVPVGDSVNKFVGSFDGRYHTISNLLINRPAADNVGLFGYAGAGSNVSNVGLVNASVIGASNVGALAGSNDGAISKSYSTGSVIASTDGSATRVGGLVGINTAYASISDAYSTASVTSGAIERSSTLVGGLVGENGGFVSGSYSTGRVSGTDDVGGLIGGNYGRVLNSYSIGNVSMSSGVSYASRFGGLVGDNTGSIRSSYATGAVAATDNVGGLVGKNNYGTIDDAYSTGTVSGNDNVGGLVGHNLGAISNAYATGNVTGLTEFGGLVGYNAGTLVNAHYDIDNVTINGAHYVTEAGLYATQYQDWLTHGKTLDIANYSASLPLSGGYNTIGSIQGLKDLLGFADNTGYKFRLTGNLDLATLPDWHIPMFAGLEFDGAGYTVANVSVNQPSNSNIGFIGRLGIASTLTGLGLTNVSVAGKDNVGSLVGYMNNGGAVSASYASGGGVSGRNYVGGLVGYNYHGTVGASYATGSVTGDSNIGGLVGYNSWGGSITDAHAGGNVTGSGGYVGGLLGYNDGGTVGTSYATGSVGGDSSVGGLVGYNNYGTVSSSYATGNVNATGDAGGLVGQNLGTIDYSYSTGAVSGRNNVGGLIGYEGGGTITNSYNTGSVSGANNAIGGLVGYNYYGTINNSYNTGSAGGGNNYAGGLVGANQGGTITNSYNTGSVYGSYSVGGLVGQNVDDSGGTISNSYSTGTVSGYNDVGGLVGGNGRFGTVTNSYSTGIVNGSIHVGGLVGYANGNIADSYSTGSVSGINYVGGLAGYRNDLTMYGSFSITNSYSSGSVTGSSSVGGLVGYNGDTVSNSYWDTTTSGQPTVGIGGGTTNGATGKTTAQMQQLATFSGWSIANTGGSENTWRIYENSSYPLLRSFLKPLAIAAASGSRAYDGTANGAGVSYSLTPDTTKFLGTLTYSGASKDVGSYTVTPGGLYSNQQGYDISFASGALTIEPYVVSLTGSRVYDGAVNVAGSALSIGTLVGVETLTLTGVGKFADKNVGAGKPIILESLALGSGTNGGLANNYTLTGGAHTASITPRSLAIAAAGVNKVYDGLTSANVTYADNRVTGDVLTIGGNAGYLDKYVGVAKTVNVNGIALSGTDAGNYTFNTTATTFADITARALNVTATGVNKVYDGQATATVTYSDNRVAGDVLTPIGGSANYLDKNVGVAKTVNVNGIALSGTDASNYTYNTSATTFADITARALNVTATGVNKVYDGLTGATVNYADNRVTGDVLAAGGSASYLDKNVGIAKTVNVSGITLTGTDAGNYTFNTTAATSADITARSLSVTAAGVNKVYDGLTGATVNYADNRVTGDVLSFGGSASYLNKNVGIAKTVNVSGITLTGADAGNYTLGSSTATTSADITARALNVTATGVAKVYDGLTGATATLSDNRVAGDVLTPGGNASYLDKNVGTAKSVNVSGITLTGADAVNYTLSGSTAATTADITVRPRSKWEGGASGNWSVASNWDALPDLSNVTEVSVPTGSTVTYDAAAGTTNLGSLTAAGLAIAGGRLNIANGLTVSSSFSQSGGVLSFGSGANASITQASGNLAMPGATLANLALAAPAGAITQTGPIVAAELKTQSQTGATLTDTGNKIAAFTAENKGTGNIALTNTAALTLGGIGNAGGNVTIDNTGAVITTGAITAPAGAVSILAHSPLTIGTAGVTAGSNITLTAGETSSTTDHLTLNGAVESTGSGAITLFSGDDLVQNASVKTNGGAVNATAQTGSISMALGTTTSSAGGAIGYKASSGNIILASLDAGSGSIDLSAAGSVKPVAGFTGANLVAAKAVIFAGGSANLSTQVKELGVTADGTFSIADLLTGSVMTNVPVIDALPTSVVPVLDQVLSTVNATTQQTSGQTTIQTTPPPPLIASVPGGLGSGYGPQTPGNTAQTIGGTEGAFGGGLGINALPAPAAGGGVGATAGNGATASAGSNSADSSGTASSSGGGSGTASGSGSSAGGDKPAVDTPSGGKPADDKVASAKDSKADDKKVERKDDKKDDDKKKDEEGGPKKQADKPAPKKLATCS